MIIENILPLALNVDDKTIGEQLTQIKFENFMNNRDALGNEIVFNNIYGFSNDSNGILEVTIGKVLGFTKTGMCTLEVISKKSALYMQELRIIEFTKPKISCKPSKLFPANNL